MTQAQTAKSTEKPNVYQFKVSNIDGKTLDLAKYKGKVLLLVNVASECGYTGQYRPLQDLYKKHGKDGLAILAFPCNDFGAQEPGNEAAIKKFAQKQYGVEFDLFAKVRIDGKNAAPLFQFLTSKETNPKHAGPIRWNFEKFLIGRNGEILARFAADVEPDSADFQDAIRKALEAK
ncbi:MAG: glutathione peroxidase [Gemmataceae bacterium]|nr:glutathione peroxidase [Gemmataceae bacterium]